MTVIAVMVVVMVVVVVVVVFSSGGAALMHGVHPQYLYIVCEPIKYYHTLICVCVYIENCMRWITRLVDR